MPSVLSSLLTSPSGGYASDLILVQFIYDKVKVGNCQAQGPTPGPTQGQGQDQDMVWSWSGSGQVRLDSNSNSNLNVGPELYTKIGFISPPTHHTHHL